MPFVVSESCGRGVQSGGAADDVDQPAAQERLATGEPDLVHAQVDRDANDTNDLVVGEHLVARQPLESLRRHAVGAAQVAAIGQRDAQVGGDASEGVDQHPPSLRSIADKRLPSVDMYRFLFSRRWLGILAAVMLFAAACGLLADWQLHRLAGTTRPESPDQGQPARAGHSGARSARRGPRPAPRRASGCPSEPPGTGTSLTSCSSGSGPTRATSGSTSSPRWSPTPDPRCS